MHCREFCWGEVFTFKKWYIFCTTGNQLPGEIWHKVLKMCDLFLKIFKKFLGFCFIRSCGNTECSIAFIVKVDEMIIILYVKYISFCPIGLHWFASWKWFDYVICKYKIDGLVQERCNSSALATELRLSCNNPSKYNLRISNICSFACWMFLSASFIISGK